MAFKIRDSAVAKLDATSLQTVPLNINLSQEAVNQAILVYDSASNSLNLSYSTGSSNTGPIGPTGPTGAAASVQTGPTGASGLPGPTGVTGATGAPAILQMTGLTTLTAVMIGSGAVINGVVPANYVAVGSNAGASTGASFSTECVFVGADAGSDRAGSAVRQVAIGGNAGRGTLGTSNTMVGYSAGYTATGYNNTHIGPYAGYTSAGVECVFIGDSAGRNATGNDCIGIGQTALMNSIGGTDIGIGSAALRPANATYSVNGQNRIAIGNQALGNQYSATGVTGTGWGNDNSIAIGTRAMSNAGNYKSTDGNIAIGVEAARYLSSDSCIAIGPLSLYSAATGANSNIAIGAYAAYQGLGGTYNVVVGPHAMQSATGSTQNVAVGHCAAQNLKTCNNCTFVGNYAAQAGFYTGTNVTVIGANATPSAAGVVNEITLGDANVTKLRCQVTTITALSDARDKKNIKPLEVGIDFINKLKPVSFEWNCRDGSKKGVKGFGFVAQDIQQTQRETNVVVPELLSDSNPDRLEVGQQALIPLLVKANQQLMAEAEELRKEIEALKSKL